MALQTKCMTPGTNITTKITPTTIEIKVVLPFILSLNKDEAKLLEYTIHNALELALAPLFVQPKYLNQVVTT